MSRDIKYIGMDVHKEAVVIAVLNGTGKQMMASIVETQASSILQFIQGLQGELHVTWEEGTWAAQCTSGRYKYLAIHIHESARQRARELATTPEFSMAQRQRKKVEALFAELKNQIGLRRLRLRRMKFVREQFFLAAAAQNIKRLVRFLSQPTPPTVLAT